jgi:hypothetical protein
MRPGANIVLNITETAATFLNDVEGVKTALFIKPRKHRRSCSSCEKLLK